ncbi:MAG: T9SS type A sorting domain-containing protein, partial [Panacibacter sp.]
TSIVNLVPSNNKLYFNAYTYKYGSELWVGEAGGASFAASPVTDNEAIKTNTATFNATLYPNPVHNTATLQIAGNAKNINLVITDIPGHKIWQGNYADQQLINISTEKFAKGVYVLIIKTDKDTRTIKFIKE